MSKKKNIDSEEQNIATTEEVTAATEAAATEDVAEQKETVSVYKPSMDEDETRKGVYIDKAEAEAFLEAQRKKKLQKKIIVSVVSAVVVLVALFIVYKVIFGGNKGRIKWSELFVNTSASKTVGDVLANDSGNVLLSTKKDSNGKTTELWFSPKDSLLQVKVTTKDGVTEVFRSWPAPTQELLDETTAQDEFPKYKDSQNILNSLVRVVYSESKIDGGSNNKAINQIEKLVTKYNVIEDGFRVEYTLPARATKTNSDFVSKAYDFQIKFVVEFYLDSTGNLIVNVPKDQIVEPQLDDIFEGQTYESYNFEDDDMPRLASVSVLPFFMASRQGDDGYYVTPDGSGGIVRFANTRIVSYDEYTKRIYGYDDTFDTFTYPNMTNETVSMPVFGVVKNNTMVTCFATESETAASIVIGQPGMKNLDLYYVGYQYKWREYYTATVGTGSSYKFLEVGIGVGDFTTKYCFDVKAENEEYTYVDVAVKTREFLIEKWNEDATSLDYLKEAVINSYDNKNTTPDVLNIKIFFNDVNQASVHLFSQFKVMTTFAEAKDIIADSSADGRTKIRYSFLGWQEDGYFGNIMKKYNIESVLGGKSGLKNVNAYAEKEDIDIAADVNLLIYYSSPTRGATLRNSVVKDAGTNYLKYKQASNAGVYKKWSDNYYMSPLYYNAKLLNKDIKNISKLGFKNVDLQQVGNLVYTDYNKENALLRQQAIEYYRKWIVAYKEAFKQVSVYYGYEYAASVADNIVDIPTSTSGIFIIDESIPFIQIVYHGLLDYYSNAINRTSNNTEALLKSIEYGAFVTYEVTKEATEELRYTNYNSLFKAQYSTLESEIKDAYVIVDKVLSPVANCTIVNHTKITADVFCTEYSNGTKIYVNYAETEYALTAQNVVPALGVMVVNGETSTTVSVG